MSTIRSFRDLQVWDKSMDLAVRCHRIAKRCRIEIVTEREADMLISDAQEVGRMLFGLVASLERTAR